MRTRKRDLSAIEDFRGEVLTELGSLKLNRFSSERLQRLLTPLGAGPSSE